MAAGTDVPVESQKTGQHPFDESLAETWMFAWLGPALRLLLAHAVRVAPFALALGGFIWVYPHLLLSGPFETGGIRGFIDTWLLLIVVVAITSFGYAVLARAEGAPHGVGAIAPLPSIMQRMVLLLVFWYALGWLLGELLTAVVGTRFFLTLGFRLFATLGWWAFPFVFWLIAPVLALYSATQVLTQIRAIRGEEPVLDIVTDSFRLIWSQYRRWLVPVWIIVGAMILLGNLFVDLLLNALAWAGTNLGWVAMAGVLALGVAFALPFWWVMERVYCPHLGVEDGLEPAYAGAAATEEPVPEDWQVEIASIERVNGPVDAARRLVDGLRRRELDGAGYALAVRGLTNRTALPGLLADLAVAWLSGGRSGELAWVVGQGIRLDPEFLMDRPGIVLNVSKRLVLQEQPGLAGLLLQRFLARHVAHADHLAAGLQLARVLATHRNDAGGARTLLLQLRQRYPDQPDIEQLLRQFS